MPTRLKRYYNAKHLHFITCCCYHRFAFFADPRCRDLFLQILEQARQRYRFVVVGYVVMPEHIHLLINEPEVGDLSVVLKVIKERVALYAHSRGLISEQSRVWQKRFYDFNVWSERKHTEKLRYMHRNPVKRGLVREPDGWAWSSFRSYAYGEAGVVRVNFQEWPLEIKLCEQQRFSETQI